MPTNAKINVPIQISPTKGNFVDNESIQGNLCYLGLFQCQIFLGWVIVMEVSPNLSDHSNIFPVVSPNKEKLWIQKVLNNTAKFHKVWNIRKSKSLFKFSTTYCLFIGCIKCKLQASKVVPSNLITYANGNGSNTLTFSFSEVYSNMNR